MDEIVSVIHTDGQPPLEVALAIVRHLQESYGAVVRDYDMDEGKGEGQIVLRIDVRRVSSARA
jgi:hypothetical protein